MYRNINFYIFHIITYFNCCIPILGFKICFLIKKKKSRTFSVAKKIDNSRKLKFPILLELFRIAQKWLNSV